MSTSTLHHAILLIKKYHSRVYEGIKQDLHQKYVGSIFGSMWTIIYPIIQLSIYGCLYNFIFKIRPPGLTEMGYVVLVFSGLVPLLAFSEALMAATNSLTSNKNILLNTVFPAELIPLRAAISAQASSVVGIVVTIATGLLLDRSSWLAIVLTPIIWCLLLMFAIGIGWLLSLVALIARDIQHILTLVTSLLFVLSPFAYTPEMIPGPLKFIIYLNPLSYFVMAFQQVICYNTFPDLIVIIPVITLGLGSFLLGLSTFMRVKSTFFDYA